MTQLPDHARIDRAAVERIIQRATELQAGEREIGESLSEHELMQLGQDVGIPPSLLRQALIEDRTRTLVIKEPGVVPRLMGPRQVTAQRTLGDEADRLRPALNRWMTEGELLTVRRRFPDQISWEARHDLFASLKRSLELGGRSYHLARAEQVGAHVVSLGDGRSHVRLLADLSNTRRSHLSGAAALTGVGAAATAIGLVLNVIVPVALLPLALGLVMGFAVVHRRRSQLARVQVALEQVLDRLEHGDIGAPVPPTGPRPSAFVRIVDEIKRSLGI